MTQTGVRHPRRLPGRRPAMADWSARGPHGGAARVPRAVRQRGRRSCAPSADCEIVVAMRERTRVSAPASFARLPRLRLLVTTGMRNAAIDMEAARARGITVCGTASRARAAGRADVGADAGAGQTRRARARRVPRRTGRGRARSAATSQGRRLGLLGLGKIGEPRRAGGPRVRHGRRGVEPEPHARARRRGGRAAGAVEGDAARDERLSSRSTSC